MKNKTNHRSVAFRRAEVKKRRIYTHFILLCICIFRFAQMSQYSLYSYILHIQTYIYYWNSVVSLKPYPEKSTHKPKKKKHIFFFSLLYIFLFCDFGCCCCSILSPQRHNDAFVNFLISAQIFSRRNSMCVEYIYIYIYTQQWR